MDELEQDDDYMYESEEDDEELEYTSEVGSIEELSNEDAESSKSELQDDFTGRLGVEVDEDTNSVGRGASFVTNEVFDESKSETEDQQRRLIIVGSSKSLSPAAEPDSTSDSHNSESPAWKTGWDKCRELEHLAAPRCEHSSGYCGFDISAEEMKGCSTVQCLVKKTPEWTTDSDDQEFELHDKYFLSGLCGQMPSRDMGGPTMTPPRHGAEYLYADVVFWNNGEVSSIDTEANSHLS